MEGCRGLLGFSDRVHQMGKPCTLHPELAPPKAKGVRAATCDAKEIDMRNHQERLKKKLGIKAFYPEPQKVEIQILAQQQ